MIELVILFILFVAATFVVVSMQLEDKPEDSLTELFKYYLIKFRNYVDFENDELEEIMEKEKTQYENIEKNMMVEPKQIFIPNLDVGNVQIDRNVRYSTVIQDLELIINTMISSELYVMDITNNINISKDSVYKKAIEQITKKILMSIQPSFRAQIYLYINENSLNDIVYSIVARQLKNIIKI